MLNRKDCHCLDPQASLLDLFQFSDSCELFNYMSESYPDHDIYYTANARSGIFEACRMIGLSECDEVLAPAYNCGSEIDPIVATGAKVTLYSTDLECAAGINNLEAKINPRTKAIYVTHYFGFPQPAIDQIYELAKHNGLYVIEDCALSLFSKDGNNVIGAKGDFVVFCFYKYYPLNLGGALIVKPGIGKASFKNPFPGDLTFKFLMKLIIFSALGRPGKDFVSKIYRNLNSSTSTKTVAFKENDFEDIPYDYYFDRKFENARMSQITKKLLAGCSVSKTIETRKRNFNYLLERVQNITGANPLFKSLPEGVVPLAFPLIVANRDRVCLELNEARVSTTRWWAGFHQGLDWKGQDDAIFLKNSVISLPIHQFLELNQIEYLYEQVKRMLKSPKDLG